MPSPASTTTTSRENGLPLAWRQFHRAWLLPPPDGPEPERRGVSGAPASATGLPARPRPRLRTVGVVTGPGGAAVAQPATGGPDRARLPARPDGAADHDPPPAPPWSRWTGAGRARPGPLPLHVTAAAGAAAAAPGGRRAAAEGATGGRGAGAARLPVAAGPGGWGGAGRPRPLGHHDPPDRAVDERLADWVPDPGPAGAAGRAADAARRPAAAARPTGPDRPEAARPGAGAGAGAGAGGGAGLGAAGTRRVEPGRAWGLAAAGGRATAGAATGPARRRAGEAGLRSAGGRLSGGRGALARTRVGPGPAAAHVRPPWAAHPEPPARPRPRRWAGHRRAHAAAPRSRPWRLRRAPAPGGAGGGGRRLPAMALLAAEPALTARRRPRCGSQRGRLPGVVPGPAGRPGRPRSPGTVAVAARVLPRNVVPARGRSDVGPLPGADDAVADGGEQVLERLAVDEHRDRDQGDHQDLQRPRQDRVAWCP